MNSDEASKLRDQIDQLVHEISFRVRGLTEIDIRNDDALKERLFQQVVTDNHSLRDAKFVYDFIVLRLNEAEAKHENRKKISNMGGAESVAYRIVNDLSKNGKVDDIESVPKPGRVAVATPNNDESDDSRRDVKRASSGGFTSRLAIGGIVLFVLIILFAAWWNGKRLRSMHTTSTTVVKSEVPKSSPDQSKPVTQTTQQTRTSTTEKVVTQEQAVLPVDVSAQLKDAVGKLSVIEDRLTAVEKELKERNQRVVAPRPAARPARTTISHASSRDRWLRDGKTFVNVSKVK